MIAPALSEPPAQRPAAVRRAPDLYYGRTPFQIALLLFATLGLYETYWLIRTRRLADYRLREEVRPYWHYWGLIVPFLNLYLMYSAASRAQRRVEASLAKSTVSFPLCLTIALVISWLWPSPSSYAIVCFLSPIPVIFMHANWARAERADDPTRQWPPLMWAEWLLIILGLLFLAFVFVGGIWLSRPEQLTVIAVAGVTVLTLLGTYWLGKKTASVEATSTP